MAKNGDEVVQVKVTVAFNGSRVVNVEMTRAQYDELQEKVDKRRNLRGPIDLDEVPGFDFKKLEEQLEFEVEDVRIPR